MTDEQLVAAVNCVENRCKGCEKCQTKDWRRATVHILTATANLTAAQELSNRLENTLRLLRKHRDELCSHNLFPPRPGATTVECSVCEHTEPF